MLTDHQVVKSEGFVGNFQEHSCACRSEPTQRLIEHGVTLVATGGQGNTAGTAYGLDSDPRIMTQGDLEQTLASWQLPDILCQMPIDRHAPMRGPVG